MEHSPKDISRVTLDNLFWVTAGHNGPMHQRFWRNGPPEMDDWIPQATDIVEQLELFL